MTKYMEDSFTVAVGGDEKYRDGWDRIFGGGEPRPDGITLSLDGKVTIAEWENGVMIGEEELEPKLVLQALELIIKMAVDYFVDEREEGADGSEK